jgi:hypothetical protein
MIEQLDYNLQLPRFIGLNIVFTKNCERLLEGDSVLSPVITTNSSLPAPFLQSRCDRSSFLAKPKVSLPETAAFIRTKAPTSVYFQSQLVNNASAAVRYFFLPLHPRRLRSDFLSFWIHR